MLRMYDIYIYIYITIRPTNHIQVRCTHIDSMIILKRYILTRTVYLLIILPAIVPKATKNVLVLNVTTALLFDFGVHSISNGKEDTKVPETLKHKYVTVIST